MLDTPPPRTLTRYGLVQLGERLGLQRWQIIRAVAAGLLPAADTATGKWPAAVVEDAANRLDAIVASAGQLPALGAHRAAAALTERFGQEVTANAVVELVVAGHEVVNDRPDQRGVLMSARAQLI